MSSLRTAFVQTSSKAPFSSLLGTLLPVSQSSSNPQQSLTCLQMRQKAKKCSPKLGIFKPLSLLNQHSLKTITKYINLNINNFSQLIDRNANDFKGCDNFIHVLQFGQGNQEQTLEEIETVMSVTRSFGCSTGDAQSKISNGQGKQEGGVGSDGLLQQEYSQVQDIQMGDP